MLRVIGILFFGSLGCGAEVLIAQQVMDTVHSDTTEVASGGSPVTLPEFGADFKGFAPGATGQIEVDLWRLYQDSKEAAKDLGIGGKDAIAPLGPDHSAMAGLDFETMRRRALADPRVHDLLGITQGDTGRAQEAYLDRFGGARIFALASFSMPDASLNALLADAAQLKVPVVFRGFVNNSVMETQKALVRVFGDLDRAQGFLIDPTVFRRFDVAVVPTFIGVDKGFDLCTTSGCVGDPSPAHDRLSGNVTLPFALRTIAQNGDVASEAAASLLASAGTPMDRLQ